ncbi:sigma-70 family RNA polymerase sigma factor [Phycicoccus sp. DTK01]|uniref:sigma-70 family RNA polymerase sigma factor n=1 Tax=Phycicoccus sp. DTK01 TaxID=2785745 RepID=UPI001A8C70EE|nr:sigma-70 family RNA polymerase sigma factor [Phycicoccus sp. DTK01]GIL36401.1 RNA polymerase sigma factor [Phycicoccus sp. DTK01]
MSQIVAVEQVPTRDHHVSGRELQRREHDERLESLLVELHGSPAGPEHDRVLTAVVTETLPLADSLALRYAGRGIETDDLVQVARAALVAAVRRYRPGAGRGFVAYAVPSVRGELKRHFRDAGWAVRPPRALQELRSELVAAEEALRHRLGRESTAGEVAEAIGRSEVDVRDARATGSAFTPDSLDAPLPGGGRVGDLLTGSADWADDLALSATLREEVRRCTPREQVIIRMRFVEERTQREIGESIGVSQMQVSRLLTQLLDRLRLRLEALPAA